MSALSKRITDYYASLNELAAMLADGTVSLREWHTQRELMYHIHHEAQPC